MARRKRRWNDAAKRKRSDRCLARRMIETGVGVSNRISSPPIDPPKLRKLRRYCCTFVSDSFACCARHFSSPGFRNARKVNRFHRKLHVENFLSIEKCTSLYFYRDICETHTNSDRLPEKTGKYMFHFNF